MLIDQFTWVPWAKQIAVIPEMRWLYALTVFPEPLAIGAVSLNRLTPRNPYKENRYAFKAAVSADDYLSAKQRVFQDMEQILDLLSLISMRGFKITKIKPAEPKTTENKGGQSFTGKLKASLIKKVTVQPVPIASAATDEAGTATVNLPPYKEYHVQSNFAGYLEEYVTFTFDAKENQSSKINLSPMKTDDFKKRLAQANENYARISSLGEVKSAMKLYRASRQLNDYLTRFILLWTALESATSVGGSGETNVASMAKKLNDMPDIEKLEEADEILDSLNRTRNTIIHEPETITHPDFQQSLPTMFAKLDRLCVNYLLFKLDLKPLPRDLGPS